MKFMIKNNENSRTNQDLTAISKNIMPLAQKILGRKGTLSFEILLHWEEIVGEELAMYSFPDKVEFRNNQRNNGVLHLSVPAGAFALEIKHREKFILEKVNAFFGYAAVSSLKILQNTDMGLYEKTEKKKSFVPQVVVSPQEKEMIKDMVCEVKNEKLKEILTKLGYNVFNLNNKM